ncbi:hypothetical protein [Gemmata sp.]|uniref:hypothetical protein n=1 Tax=Gemmata sp. TaxID=1914242 RepID=UPI003F6F6004
MKLNHRVRAAERTADRHRAPHSRTSVCDRIDALTAAYLTTPTTFAPAVEAGILAAVEREFRANDPLSDTQADRA